MSVITTGAWPKALWEGVHEFFGLQYDEHPEEWPELFEKLNSDKKYEEDVQGSSFGLAPTKGEGAAVAYDGESQGWISRYTHVAYALGFIVTREDRDDNLYEEIAMGRAGRLSFSMRQTKETVLANVYNRAFNSSYTGGDGKELLATDHPVVGGGTQSNELSTAADFSEAALEDLLILIDGAENERGHKIGITGQKLIVPRQLRFDVERVMQSEYQTGTANNDINPIAKGRYLPQGFAVNHYLTDPDAWFVRTNCPSGMRMFERVATELSQDNDFDTENMKAKAYMRFSGGWSDWRGLYGSPGA